MSWCDGVVAFIRDTRFKRQINKSVEKDYIKYSKERGESTHSLNSGTTLRNLKGSVCGPCHDTCLDRKLPLHLFARYLPVRKTSTNHEGEIGIVLRLFNVTSSPIHRFIKKIHFSLKLEFLKQSTI